MSLLLELFPNSKSHKKLSFCCLQENGCMEALDFPSHYDSSCHMRSCFYWHHDHNLLTGISLVDDQVACWFQSKLWLRTICWEPWIPPDVSWWWQLGAHLSLLAVLITMRPQSAYASPGAGNVLQAQRNIDNGWMWFSSDPYLVWLETRDQFARQGYGQGYLRFWSKRLYIIMTVIEQILMKIFWIKEIIK